MISLKPTVMLENSAKLLMKMIQIGVCTVLQKSSQTISLGHKMATALLGYQKKQLRKNVPTSPWTCGLTVPVFPAPGQGFPDTPDHAQRRGFPNKPTLVTQQIIILETRAGMKQISTKFVEP